MASFRDVYPNITVDNAVETVRDELCRFCGESGDYSLYYKTSNHVGVKCENCGRNNPFNDRERQLLWLPTYPVGEKSPFRSGNVVNVTKEWGENNMPSDGNDEIEVEGHIEATTQKAWLFVDNNTCNQGWIPRSYCRLITEPDREGLVTVVMPKWIARQREFIE